MRQIMSSTLNLCKVFHIDVVRKSISLNTYMQTYLHNLQNLTHSKFLHVKNKQ
jgi:hypothetical protein